MISKWTPPEGHPIDEKKAKELIGGYLGKEYRRILQSCCTPIFWYENKANSSILNNGTVTIVRTPDRLLGVTAAHIVNSYFEQSKNLNIKLQIGEEVVPDLEKRIIAISDELDLATIHLEPSALDKQIIPLSWPPKIPQEGRGIMLAGYPGKERLEEKRTCNFGSFTAIGIARTVTNDQITFLVEREFVVPSKDIADLPRNYDLGGISGGPVISWFETKSFIASYHFAGIVSEASSDYENIIAKRADFIEPDGSIKKL
jgi:hypothetical protein